MWRGKSFETNMTDDAQLLRSYAEEHLEAAFRELVARHMNLVYSIACRWTDGDVHLAEDIVQQVFTDLARDAQAISGRYVLGGWLYRHACYVAAQTMRSERRRQARERAAVVMNESDTQEAGLWRQIAPVLDEAMAQLNMADRSALVLRFIENKDLRQVGAAIGVSEDTAQKRVSRALEKLRQLLLKQGVTSSTGALAVILGGYTVSAAPAGLAASVASAALASAGGGSVALLTLLKIMALTKLKLAAGVVVIAGIGTTLVVEQQRSNKLREENHALQEQIDQLAQQGGSPLARRIFRPRLPAPRVPVVATAAEAPGENSRPTNFMAGLMLANGEGPKLTVAQLDRYLDQSHRSAESLLAAFRATGDRSLLQEAIEKFPKDPHVNFTAALASQSPEERRQHLDALKQSASDNALVNYLSAQEYFKTGQTDKAVEELLAAAGKSRFQDYSGEFIQNAEEAYRAAGYSEAHAKAVAGFSLELPQLAQLKQLSQNLGELANLYRQGGDQQSAHAAQQLGLELGQRLLDGLIGQKTTIHEAVGLSIQRLILEGMDPAAPYDSAGHTVKDRLAEVTQQRESIKFLNDPETSLLPQLSEPDLISFFDRLKVSGEREAAGELRRQRRRHGPRRALHQPSRRGGGQRGQPLRGGLWERQHSPGPPGLPGCADD